VGKLVTKMNDYSPRWCRSSTHDKNEKSIKGVPGQGSQGELPSLPHCFWSCHIV